MKLKRYSIFLLFFAVSLLFASCGELPEAFDSDTEKNPAKASEEKTRDTYKALESVIDETSYINATTEYDEDVRVGGDDIEAIFTWGDDHESWEYIKQAAAHYAPYDEGYDENNKTAFIENYLREQGMYRDKSVGITYNSNGEPLAEYYIDEVGQKVCFVVHLWGDYWIDYEAGISTYTDAIYCTTISLDESNKSGNIIRDYDADQNAVREKLYDAQGKKMADISYDYISGIPFPFITEYWNLNTWYGLIDGALCRNQKTWFYKDQARFDELGRVIGYNGGVNENDGKEYLSYASSWSYNSDGKLETILEEYDDDTDPHNSISSCITFEYHDNGIPNTAEYRRSSYVYGTLDAHGIIEYDEMGRMLYNEYYVTHGSHVNIYLYEDDEVMPWACINWCSHITSGIERIYLFKPC